ncbi:MFS transporter [Nocardia sp. NPDC005998]|uniref:MFS transporter n=1 Tax=Nocardia sp. NPDC005998 TaxID=3156894 RepID=UPI0033BDCA2F
MTRVVQDTAAVPSSMPRLGRLMAAYSGAQLVLAVCVTGAMQVMLPNQIAEVAGEHKVAVFGLVTGVGAVANMIAQPVSGALSDRTATRFGRRMPWLVGGAAGGLVALAVLGSATTVLWIAVCWGLMQLCVGAMTAPLSAVVPDGAPVEKRGLVSALGGIGMFVGALAGVAVAAAFGERLPTGYLTLGGLLAVGCALCAALAGERPGTRSAGAGLQWRLPHVADHPDFAWAFLARFLIVLGYQALLSYLRYILSDYIGLSVSEANAAMPTLAAVVTIAVLAGLLPVAILSDRMGRRKVFVVVASLVIAGSAAIPLVWPTLNGLYVSLAIAGLGIGGYAGVDQALMTQVLPRAEDSGRDLGLLNIANNGAQVLAPLAASLVIAFCGGYPVLYASAIVLAVLGAVAIVPIKSVR